MWAKESTSDNRKSINIKIVQTAIELIQNKGHPFKVENLNGFAQEFEEGNLGICYSTPFSGADILPGEKAYILDIWWQHKKVYSVYFMDIDELSNCKKRPKGKWLDTLMALEVA